MMKKSVHLKIDTNSGSVPNHPKMGTQIPLRQEWTACGKAHDGT